MAFNMNLYQIYTIYKMLSSEYKLLKGVGLIKPDRFIVPFASFPQTNTPLFQFLFDYGIGE